MKNIKQNILSASILLCASILSGCNDNEGEAPPPGSNITISPSSKEWQIESAANCRLDGPYEDEVVNISIFDGQGRVLSEVDVAVSLDLTAQSRGRPDSVLRLYEDRNGDLIPDDNELVSGPDMPVLETKTGKFTGSVNLIVRMNLSCDYRGIMTVIAANTVSTAEFVVVAEDEDEEMESMP